MSNRRVNIQCRIKDGVATPTDYNLRFVLFHFNSGCYSKMRSGALDEEEKMTDGKYRVVVWSTGGIGSIAIRAINERPNLDLVGVWVHSPEKDGMDAGELANGEPIGLNVTTDADALIALKPDCVIYAASGPERDAVAIPDYVKLLSAGINVVTTSTTRLVNPHAYEPAEWRDQLATAAKEGQVSLYASGIEPGFAADYLPLVLSTAVVADREDPRLRDRSVRRLRRARHHE